MSRAKEVGTAVGTLACALGIGFAMQSTHTASHLDIASTAEPSTRVVGTARVEDRVTEKPIAVRDITLTSALATRGLSLSKDKNTDPSRSVASFKRAYTAPSFIEVAESGACPVTSQAAAREAALVRLTLTAACRPHEIVTINHSGMMFSAMTDAKGELSVTVPALAKAAVFVFSFDDGEGSVAFSTVPDLEQYKRVVLQWRGDAGFELHAREFGADYGTEGHVWRGTKTQLSRMTDGEGGVLTPLGKPSTRKQLMAEVYSIPSNFPQRDGSIDLSIEALVSESNCGSEVEAETFELNGSSELRRRHLSLAMPACDTVGDYLVLNNVLDSLTVSAN